MVTDRRSHVALPRMLGLLVDRSAQILKSLQVAGELGVVGRARDVHLDFHPDVPETLGLRSPCQIVFVDAAAVAVTVGRLPATTAQAAVSECALPGNDVDGASADSASGFWRWGAADS